MENSKKNSKPKDNRKMITCKNCRQDIEAEKMFLHEGFCQRNNIFCDHCQKVFLKKDYENHFKSSQKMSMRHLKTPERPKRSEKEAKIQTINIYTSPIITKRKTTFEYIEMPMTEQYKVNNPIIISENGQIVSNTNTNEYLLPYFGINSSNNSERKTILGDDVIINQDEFFEEKNPIIINGNTNINEYIESSLRNSLSMKNINKTINTYQNINEVDNSGINNNDFNSKLNIIDLTENNEFMSNKNILNRSHSSRILLNNINLNKDEMDQQNINLNPEYMQNNSDSKKVKKENKPKNNNIIINNNIITYNSNNNINKIHNFYNTEKDSFNNSKSLMNNDIFQDINATKFNPTRTSKKKEIIEFKKNLKINILNNASKINSKVPNDSGNKKKPRNKKINTYIIDRTYKNSKEKNINQRKTEKTDKICEFCGSEVDELVTHYKIYHYKMSKEILKPQKRDTVLLNEKLNSTNIDETGIEESNKKILLRQFKPSFNIITKINNNSKNFKTTAKKRKYQAKFISPQRITKVKKIDIKNFETNKKSEKKLFPEDNFRGSFIAKTQAREYERKNIIYIGNNLGDNLNRTNKKGVTIFPLDNHENDNNYEFNKRISPKYLFTEEKKDDFFKRQIKSPVVKKINFLKTLFGEDDFY